MPFRLAQPARPVVRFFRRPWAQLALAASFLVLDYHAGALFIQFPIAFIFPVAFAAWYSRWEWAAFLAVLQPAARFGFNFVWHHPQPVWVSLTNFGIRAFVLLLICYLIQRTARQTRALAREVKLLEGILPICSYCKKIRDEKNEWQVLETYIHNRTNADFSHGICPTCVKERYEEMLG